MDAAILSLPYLVILIAIYLLIRGWDVRLVLFSAGLAMAAIALKPWLVLDAFFRQMGNGEIIGPICSSMGYAYVLKATSNDQDMVRLLIAPVRRIRWLLVPGGCAVGFLTNMAVTSQAASAASVGAVLVPLMLRAGFHPVTIGATLVLGCSGGGNLYNPGEPDIVAIYENTKAHGVALFDVLDSVFLPELLGFCAAVATFTIFNRRTQDNADTALRPGPPAQASQPVTEDEHRPINIFKALLPPLPIVLLILVQPRFGLFPGLLERYPHGLPVPHVMLFSTMVALLIARRDLSSHTKAFFEGMGYAYINIISLIITATCFIEGMKAVGLIDVLVSAISGRGLYGAAASGVFPWMLAIVSGSGTAPSVAFSAAVLPTLSQSNPQTAVDLGVLAAIAATFGRTMSPVAAVVIFTSTMVDVTPLQIVRRTAPALAVGAVVAFLVIVMR